MLADAVDRSMSVRRNSTPNARSRPGDREPSSRKRQYANRPVDHRHPSPTKIHADVRVVQLPPVASYVSFRPRLTSSRISVDADAWTATSRGIRGTLTGLRAHRFAVCRRGHNRSGPHCVEKRRKPAQAAPHPACRAVALSAGRDNAAIIGAAEPPGRDRLSGSVLVALALFDLLDVLNREFSCVPISARLGRGSSPS